MLRRILVWVVMVLEAQGFHALRARGQTVSPAPAENTAGLRRMPKQLMGLKALLQDIFEAEKVSDAAQSTRLCERC